MSDIYKILLGSGHDMVETAVAEGWVGVGWLGDVDLTGRFPDNLSDLKSEFMPSMSGDSKGSKISASNACTALYVIGKQMRDGDVIVTPSGRGTFLLARANGPYYFAGGQPLPHRRPVEWLDVEIPKEELTQNLQKTLSTPRTLSHLLGYPEEIQASYDEQIRSYLSGAPISRESTRRVEETVSFVMEKYLEEFLVKNWEKTVLAEDWDLVESQVQSEVGRLDILAKSKDDQTMLVIELKLNRANDQVLGQVQRYMGWVKSELEPDKEVKGLIIGDQLDPKLEYALSVVDNVSFMRYEMDFRLLDVE